MPARMFSVEMHIATAVIEVWSQSWNVLVCLHCMPASSECVCSARLFQDHPKVFADKSCRV